MVDIDFEEVWGTGHVDIHMPTLLSSVQLLESSPEAWYHEHGRGPHAAHFGFLDWNLFAGCCQSYTGQYNDHLQLWSFFGDENSFPGDKKAISDFVDLHWFHLSRLLR